MNSIKFAHSHIQVEFVLAKFPAKAERAETSAVLTSPSMETFHETTLIDGAFIWKIESDFSFEANLPYY
jgi:hypothetical protein